METFVLILFFHVGIWGETDSNATTNIRGFASQSECQQAGRDAAELVKSTKKEYRFVCVRQTTVYQE